MEGSMTDFSAAPPLDCREQHFRIPGPRQELSLFLRFLPAEKTRFEPRRAVLYVHGATFPSAVSVAHRFDGKSWRDALGEAGFDVWGLDFYGFGHSDRYPEMDSLRPTIPLCASRRMPPRSWRPPFDLSWRTRTSRKCR